MDLGVLLESWLLNVSQTLKKKKKLSISAVQYRLYFYNVKRANGSSLTLTDGRKHIINSEFDLWNSNFLADKNIYFKQCEQISQATKTNLPNHE